MHLRMYHVPTTGTGIRIQDPGPHLVEWAPPIVRLQVMFPVLFAHAHERESPHVEILREGSCRTHLRAAAS